MVDKAYQDILRKVLNDGERKPNRTGVDTIAVIGHMFEHDMSEGFPLLTLRKLPYRSIRVELEGFIKGITSKRWFQDRKCKYWDEWCNPWKVPYGTDDETKAKMKEEDDLGPIYGAQWRDFSDPNPPETVCGDTTFCGGNSVDQLRNIVATLKKNPNDRRMICSAWNPLALGHMALPPCHVLWQVTVVNGKLNLTWYQRSCDLYLGIPSNIASYATLLHLLAKEAGLKEGKLIGFWNDVHLYDNQTKLAVELLMRDPTESPRIETEKFTSIFDWEYSDTKLIGYNPNPELTCEVVV